MTKQEVEHLITLIRAYYPTKKILDNELEVMVWCDEFANYDKEKVIKATRELCRTIENNFDINIASIKNQVLRNEKEQAEIESDKQYKLECEQREKLMLNEKDREIVHKKIQQTINLIKGKRNE